MEMETVSNIIMAERSNHKEKKGEKRKKCKRNQKVFGMFVFVSLRGNERWFKI